MSREGGARAGPGGSPAANASPAASPASSDTAAASGQSPATRPSASPRPTLAPVATPEYTAPSEPGGPATLDPEPESEPATAAGTEEFAEVNLDEEDSAIALAEDAAVEGDEPELAESVDDEDDGEDHTKVLPRD